MNEPADFKAFFLSLSESDRDRLAVMSGTTVGNVRAHWMHARRVPRSAAAMDKLFEACKSLGAGFSKAQLLAFFYDVRVEPSAEHVE
jgi:hypothetical protein